MAEMVSDIGTTDHLNKRLSPTELFHKILALARHDHLRLTAKQREEFNECVDATGLRREATVMTFDRLCAPLLDLALRALSSRETCVLMDLICSSRGKTKQKLNFKSIGMRTRMSRISASKIIKRFESIGLIGLKRCTDCSFMAEFTGLRALKLEKNTAGGFSAPTVEAVELFVSCMTKHGVKEIAPRRTPKQVLTQLPALVATVEESLRSEWQGQAEEADHAGSAWEFTDEAPDADDFDEDGFDVEGYDLDGYDAHGFDRSGFDKDGGDEDGRTSVELANDFEHVMGYQDGYLAGSEELRSGSKAEFRVSENIEADERTKGRAAGLADALAGRSPVDGDEYYFVGYDRGMLAGMALREAGGALPDIGAEDQPDYAQGYADGLVEGFTSAS